MTPLILKTGKILLNLVFFFSFSVHALATEGSIEVHAKVNRNKMGLNDKLNLSVVVVSEESMIVEEPRIPQLVGFELLNTWTSQSSQTQIEQGPQGMEVKTTKIKQFEYILSPKKKGILVISSFRVNVQGKIYKTKPIRIQVAKRFSSPPVTKKNRGRGLGRGRKIDPFSSEPFSEVEKMFNQLLQRQRGGGFSGSKGELKKEILDPKEVFFIQAEVDKKEVYVGEQVTVSWYIYTRGAIESIDRLKFPVLKNFWKEDIDVSPSLRFHQYLVNGLPYRRALLGSYALFPIKAGQAVIDSYSVRCRVRLNTRFGLGRSRLYTKKSRVLRIKVKSLPKVGKPDSFTGAVGHFQVKSDVNAHQFPVNQPFSIKIRFEGEGNAKLIDIPAIRWPEHLELYDTKKESKFFKTGKSYKEFEVLLIPRREGKIKIPSMKLGLFNPKSGKYEEKSTDEIELEITHGRQDGVIASSRKLPEFKKKIEEREDLPLMILSAERDPILSEMQEKWMWVGIYFLILLFLIWYGSVQLGWGDKKKNLQEQVSQRIKLIFNKIEKGDHRSIGSEMTNLVYFVLGEISGQGGANLEFSKLMEKAPPSVRKELKKPLGKLMNSFEIIGFAPDSVIGDLKEKEELRLLVKKMEIVLLKAIQKN